MRSQNPDLRKRRESYWIYIPATISTSRRTEYRTLSIVLYLFFHFHFPFLYNLPFLYFAFVFSLVHIPFCIDAVSACISFVLLWFL